MLFILFVLILLLIILIIIVLCKTIRNFQENYGVSSSPETTEILQEIKLRIAKINPEYYYIPIKEGKSSFTRYKRTISLCMKNPRTKEIYNINILMYVVLHEVGHVITKSKGHGAEFQKNFSLLLSQAVNLGIYDPSVPIPEDYCK